MNILLIVVVVIFVWYIYEFNLIKSLHNKVLQSRSGIDVALNKRFDLIPNLVECVKGYAKHEEKLLQIVMQQRSEFYKTKNLSQGSELSNNCNQLLALSERYPDLKASEQFLSLQDALERTESQLSAARRLYNSDVTMYNTKILTFPGNIIAGMMHATQENLFEIEEYKRENIKIKDI